MTLKTRPLHSHFGVMVEDVDLNDVDGEHGFADIRAMFEEHSALLFPRQAISDGTHTRLAKLFGPLENREAMATQDDVPFAVSNVSNVLADGSVHGHGDLRTLDLQANMLWHTDSTFLPIPALVNLLMAKVVPSSGGETELASTRAALVEMPQTMRDQLRQSIIWHRLSHSRARISAELATLPKMTRWPDRPWRAIWPNPVNGRESVYIASHAFAVEGMAAPAGTAFIDEVLEFCTQSRFVYTHRWEPGDMLIWDERAVLHRGQPWNYDEPRTLKSICCSATDDDGVPSVRLVG
jgi:alpha-ketoglutarate-dependent 2,4-dichlorophenoxyacetate dioxygenase